MSEGKRRREYEELTDEELIERLRGGEGEIAEYICDKYKNLVRKKAGSMHILGGERDDLIQEGMIGLFKAVRDYDSGRDASFYTFAELCISRQLYTALQAAGRQKHRLLNTYTPLEEQTASAASPEELFLDKERAAQLKADMDKELSPFEKQVLDLYMTGMSYVQIARVLGREEKSTDNALQRLKGKIRKLL